MPDTIAKQFADQYEPLMNIAAYKREVKLKSTDRTVENPEATKPGVCKECYHFSDGSTLVFSLNPQGRLIVTHNNGKSKR